MQHSRFLSPRFLAAACAFLTVSSMGLGLPQRGAAQDDMTRRPPVPGDASPGSAPSGTSDPNSGDNGSANDGGVNNGSVNNGDPNYSDSNGTGGAAAGPSVGVDNSGSAGAVGTRSGRTNRQRRMTPPNPLLLTIPTRGNGPGTNRGPGDGRIAPPLIPMREPGIYTLQTDPFQPRIRPGSRPLPLFGYEVFQPARQIIIARRRALLPRPVRTQSQTDTAARRRSTQVQTQSGSGGTNASSSGGLGRGANSLDANGINAAGLGANGLDPNGSLNNANRGSLGTAGRAAAGAAGLAGDNTGDTSANGDTSTNLGNGSNDPNALDTSSAGGMTDNGQTDTNQTNTNQTDASQTDASQTDTSQTDTSGDGSLNGMGAYGSGNNQTRRRRRTTDVYPGSGGAFPGDTAAPGSDIQFPGDDALLQGGAGSGTNGVTDAVGGQLADPVASLYRGVFTSLPINYQIQPGDALTVRYEALTLAPREFNTTVDSQGGIAVEGVGRLLVAGRTQTAAEATLRAQLARLYRNVSVSISLRQLRTIQVTVSGAAFSPGTYPIPASTTAFSLLQATGGPTANGSLRDIRVLRGGRRVGTLDVYSLIAAGGSSPRANRGDINLRSGDTIYIPSPVSRVSVRGEVRQQAIYELTSAETLRDVLGYAGGVKPSGVDQNVHIDTVNNGTGRIIVDVNLRDHAQVARTPLYDGDTVEVSSVRAILTNRVTISGAVDQPGDYALTPRMRVGDLLARARGPLLNAYLGRAELTHLNADLTTSVQTVSITGVLDHDPAQDLPLKRFDILRLFSLQDVSYLGRRTVEVRGDVQRPGIYTQSDNMKVSDLLLETGGPLPDAYLSRAVLLHQRGDGTYAYDYVNLHEALGGNAEEDKAILDNDVLAIYRIGEAHFTPDHTVKVLGDVVAPGLYARGEGMKISDLVKLSGAYKPGGGTVVTLSHARQPNTATPSLVTAPVIVAYNGAGTLAPSGDTVLLDGDVVTVQGNGTIKDHPPIVTVTGAVAHPGPFPIDSATRLSEAIHKAGGLLPEAFPQGAEFTRTSDTLITTGQMNLAQTINKMNDMLNQGQYQRERAKASLELIQLAGSAASGSSGSAIPIPGLSPGGGAANPNVSGLVDNLRTINPVSPGRLLTPSQLQPNGSVAVRLADALKHPGSGEDFLLKDGDTIVVPEMPTTVQVVGAVINGRGVLFKPGQSVDHYIKYVGGFTPDAAKDRIEIIHAGGGLIPASDAGAIQPGDLILVPTKVLAEKISRGGNSFSNLFQGLVSSAIVLRLLTH